MPPSSKPLKPKPTPTNSPNYPSSTTSTTTTTPPCKHSSPSATTLDLLILLLVLFSGAFLLTSYCSYILHSFSLLLPSIRASFNPTHLYYIVFSVSFVTILTFFEICCVPRSRKCGRPKCKGLRKCMEFDLQLIKEGSLRGGNECEKSKKSGKDGVKEVNECEKTRKSGDWSVEEIEELPWKGGSESNPDYECLRAELRKMAPPNGKAVLLFRAKCGCPLAKLEGWGPGPGAGAGAGAGAGVKQRGRRLKKSLALNGGGDHR